MPRKEWTNVCICGAKYEVRDSLVRHVAIYNDPRVHAIKRGDRTLDKDQKYSLYAALEDAGHKLSPVEQETLYMRVEFIISVGHYDPQSLRHTLYIDDFRLKEEQWLALEQMVGTIVREHA